MASAGQNFNQSVAVAQNQDTVSQALIAATAGVPEYTVTTAGTGSIVLTRRYTPTWAIVAAVIGVLLFLIGLLALLYKMTETISITLTPFQGGTKITVSGTGSREMLTRITATVSAMPELDTSATSMVDTPAQAGAISAMSDSKNCPACAETVKAAAKVCRYCGHQFELSDQQSPRPSEG